MQRARIARSSGFIGLCPAAPARLAAHPPRIAADIPALALFQKRHLRWRSSRTSDPLRDRPVEQRQRVGLVVVGRLEAELADGGDDRRLVGVALAGDVPLDRADRHALVRDLVRLGPGGEMREVAAVGVRRQRCRDAA